MRTAVDNPGWFPFTSDEIDLGRSMVTAWGSFATVRWRGTLARACVAPDPREPAQTGSPGLAWNAYSAASDNDYQFMTPISSSAEQFELRKQYCDFWDSVGYHF